MKWIPDPATLVTKYNKQYAVFPTGIDCEYNEQAFPNCRVVCFNGYENAYDVTPRYPMPAIIPQRDFSTYSGCWDTIHHAARWFNSIGDGGGINWAWKYFLSMSDAIGFDTWCQRNAVETGGVYEAWERGPIGCFYYR